MGSGPEGTAGQEGIIRYAHGELEYIRMGPTPPNERSWNSVRKNHELGVSVFYGRRFPGRYRFNFPANPHYASLTTSLVSFMLNGRPAYTASGTCIGHGPDGEPLLRDVTLRPISRHARFELPLWLGRPGEAFASAWSKWWRNEGFRNTSGTLYSSSSWALERLGIEVLVEMARCFGGSDLNAERKKARSVLKGVRREFFESVRRMGG